MTLAPGTHLGPYEIVGRIGAGSMGEVWKARDTRLGREVAPSGGRGGAEEPPRAARHGGSHDDDDGEQPPPPAPSLAYAHCTHCVPPPV